AACNSSAVRTPPRQEPTTRRRCEPPQRFPRARALLQRFDIEPAAGWSRPPPCTTSTNAESRCLAIVDRTEIEDDMAPWHYLAEGGTHFIARLARQSKNILGIPSGPERLIYRMR